jgi:hypothetical protein
MEDFNYVFICIFYWLDFSPIRIFQRFSELREEAQNF